MTGRLVVGYQATKAGRDAVTFASRMAAASAASLDIVIVLPADSRSVITPPDAGYERYLHEQAQSWVSAAGAEVPAGVEHRAHVRYGESFAEGLIEFADEVDATCIVVGAAGNAARGHHRLGSTTNELLHTSDVPVVLVPLGARKIAHDTAITRVTAAVGLRSGADVLLEEATGLATSAGVPMRLLSLVTVDLPASVNTGVIRIAGAAHAEEVLAATHAALPDGIDAEVVTARGEDIEDAVADLDWQPGEVLLVGSSRLAQPQRLFLGSTAAKMLREVPVPVIVVPRTRGPQEGAGR